MKLSEHLKQWRAERPSEWKMDEFIRAAEKLEADKSRLVEALSFCEVYFSNEKGTKEESLFNSIQQLLTEMKEQNNG